MTTPAEYSWSDIEETLLCVSSTGIPAIMPKDVADAILAQVAALDLEITSLKRQLGEEFTAGHIHALGG